MADRRTLADLQTPAAVVDLDRVHANLDRMAAYAKEHGLALRPHTKTHKTPDFAAEQIRRGAVGVTVATVHEAEVMAAVADDILMAYPPVGQVKIDRLLSLPDDVRITVALDSAAVLEPLATASARVGRETGVLVEVDVGMGRCGLPEPGDVVALAREVDDQPGAVYRGILFYPGQIREPVAEQDPALEQLGDVLGRHLDALAQAGLEPTVVSGGSTPTAYQSHRVPAVTEIRPGTYIYNDRTTAGIDACRWEDCAYTILATVVSTAVPGQAILDSGSKALAREEIRAPGATGYGALLDRPDVVVRSVSEEHGILDLSDTSWRPNVGDRVRVVPNHVCVSVNLQKRVWGVRGETVEAVWPVAARGWAPATAT